MKIAWQKCIFDKVETWVKWTMVYALVKMHHMANGSPFVLLKIGFRYP
jgi:hypothetical protein